MIVKIIVFLFSLNVLISNKNTPYQYMRKWKKYDDQKSSHNY